MVGNKKHRRWYVYELYRVDDKSNSQIVKYRDEQEMRNVCAEIQSFIEREGIDVCFVMNEQELKDCLQNHNELKLRIAELESELDKKNQEIDELNKQVKWR